MVSLGSLSRFLICHSRLIRHKHMGQFANTTFTITVANRPQRILYMLYVAARKTGASGQVAYIMGLINGFDTSPSPIFDKANTGSANAFIGSFAGTRRLTRTVSALLSV